MNYLKINREAWNVKTEIHLKSEFYDQEGFLDGRITLKRPELEVLKDIQGKRILHLQCHFGQDTISLARLGGIVTGLDFSDVSISHAKGINNELNMNVDFICSDVYNLPVELEQQFDIVFTSYGTIGWLPELSSWAKTISKALVPGGKFVMVDFHPFIWTFDNNLQKIEYDYFNGDPIIEDLEGTYADRKAPISTKTVSWNHGIGEILNSLLQNGISIQELTEFDFSPYNCFENMKEIEKNRFVFTHLNSRIPILYRIVGCKNSE